MALFLICSFFATVTVAQTRIEDSLNTLLVKQKNYDSNRVNTLLELFKNYSGEDTSKRISYARQALAISDQIGFGKGKAFALKSIGLIYFGKSQFLEALNYWKASLKQFELNGDVNGEANMLNNIGAVFQQQSIEDQALDYYLRSLKKAEITGNKLRIMTAYQNIGSVYANKKTTRDQGLVYYKKALPIAEEIANSQAIGTITVNIGEIYIKQGNADSIHKIRNADSAQIYLKRSLTTFEELKQNAERSYALINLGKVATLRNDYDAALKYHKQALEVAKRTDSKYYISLALQGIGENEFKSGNMDAALSAYKEAEGLSREMKNNYDLDVIYNGLTNVYTFLGDFKMSVQYLNLTLKVKDEIYNAETDKKLNKMLFEAESEQQQGKIKLLTKDKELQEAELNKQKFVQKALFVGFTLIFIIGFILFRDYRQKIRINKLLDSQKIQIETLLLNILPSEVAKELQEKGEATPRYYEHASVLFTDFKSFSALADKLSPQEVVSELNECFIEFDLIIRKFNLEKIKTIGDSYMCAGGIPTPNPDHVMNIVKASLEIQEYIKMRNNRRSEENLPPWDIRIGIHTGPLVAGVVGKIKYAYDIWGGTVNIASRMESNGEPGRVNISAAMYELIKHEYNCSYRGKIFAKNIGEIDMYFIDEKIA